MYGKTLSQIRKAIIICLIIGFILGGTVAAGNEAFPLVFIGIPMAIVFLAFYLGRSLWGYFKCFWPAMFLLVYAFIKKEFDFYLCETTRTYYVGICEKKGKFVDWVGNEYRLETKSGLYYDDDGKEYKRV